MLKTIALISMVVILCIVNWSIVGKERHLAEGRVVYLALAPVDPRSLMQGDYMALSFEIADHVFTALSEQKDDSSETSDGYAVVNLDEYQIGIFKRLHGEQSLADNDVVIRYRIRNGEIKLATDAYFFQEGDGEFFEAARYGQFRVDDNGELLLAAMYDEQLVKLDPNEEKSNAN